jgi:protein-tyrosine phosphatase
MAAAILSEFGGDRYAASSAGTFVFGAYPIMRSAAFTLESVGISKYNYIPHRSRPITEKLMKDNDIIVAMTDGHRDIILKLFPEYADKVRTFSADIGDFANGDIVAYQKAYVAMKKGIYEMFSL